MKGKRKKPIRPGSKAVWTAAALVALGLAVAVILGEVVLRAAYGDKFGRRPAFYTSDNLLGWKPAANLDHTFYGPDFSIHVRTDDAGYRLGARGNVDFDKKLILLCGDSYTFGWGVSTGETFASFLDEMVAEYTGGGMRAVNFGVGGYGTLQHAERIDAFMDDHPRADVAAVLVVHCQNDAVDNVRSIGYQLGAWESTQNEPARSRWHLVNFARYAWHGLSQIGRNRTDSFDEAETRDPFLQDILWSHNISEVVPLPPAFSVGTDSVLLVGASREDISEAALMKRKGLTRIQREVMFVGNKVIHSHARRLDSPVYHTFVYTTADWYISEVDREIGRSATTATFGMGRVPAKGAFKGPYFNEHSGRHYNIRFNRFWAGRVFDLLVESGVVVAPGG